jgi:hypothetical protein
MGFFLVVCKLGDHVGCRVTGVCIGQWGGGG